jgi:hypothetical protein
MRTKPTAKKQLGLVPVELTWQGQRTVLQASPDGVRLLSEIFAAAGRDAARLEEQAASRQPTRAISAERFERGLQLLVWIEHLGRGKLTKELVTEIKDGCPDWPCVQDYRMHRSREKLRNALRDLADDTRRAVRDRRLPANWAES